MKCPPFLVQAHGCILNMDLLSQFLAHELASRPKPVSQDGGNARGNASSSSLPLGGNAAGNAPGNAPGNASASASSLPAAAPSSVVSAPTPAPKRKRYKWTDEHGKQHRTSVCGEVTDRANVCKVARAQRAVNQAERVSKFAVDTLVVADAQIKDAGGRSNLKFNVARMWGKKTLRGVGLILQRLRQETINVVSNGGRTSLSMPKKLVGTPENFVWNS